MEDFEGKKILIIQTHGVDTPKRTYSPLYYAVASAAMEIETTVWFTMNGTNQLRKGVAEMIKLDPSSNVTLASMLQMCLDNEVKLAVCQQSLALWNMTPDDLIDDIEIFGATSIIDLALNYDHVMYF